MSEFNPLLIHKDNTPLKTQVKILEKFDIETFDFGNSDLDTYISQIFLPKLQQKEFNILFIKDNLSDNYLELYGITLAYHIRLSAELGDKRFVPIVIISDVDGYILNKLTPMANILFTKNTFVARNEISSYDYFERVFEEIKPFNDFKKEFLDLIHIDPPQDYLSHHDISNEWSIYRWAEFLNVDTDTTKANKAKVENMLYFKYLNAQHTKKETQSEHIEKPSRTGKVLLVDDEWAKGWKDILKRALTADGLEFDTFEYDFKDKTNFNMTVRLNYKKLKEQITQSDVVILDLRLLKSDHENEDLGSYTGIKILQKIHEINAGIQVIMLTATSKSIILEKLYEKKILGYIKKEHPDDSSIDTVENINKLVGLVDSGLERKYLKEMYLLKIQIMDILNNDPFCKFISKKEEYEYFLGLLQKNSQYVFDILDSNLGNKFNYAMVSIATSLESIVKIFLHGKNDLLFWDEEEAYLNEKSKLEDKITKILNKKMGYKEDVKLEDLITHRNRYMHSNSEYKEVTEEKISDWFGEFLKIMQLIENPPNYIPFDKSKKKESKHLNFKKDKI